MPANGLAAAASQLSGFTGAPETASGCSFGCTKASCNGCEAGFGCITEHAWGIVVRFCAAVDAAEADAMTPPFSAGQRVTFDGAEYAFVRYHKTHRGIKCILSSASETVSWVPEEALIVKHHTVLYYRELAVRCGLLGGDDTHGLLPGGESELVFRAHQYRKWVDNAPPS